MTDPVLAQAQWAVWSKFPGTRDDYAVVAASSGLFSRSEFDRLVRVFTPGNPITEPGTAGSLPWVILSRVGVSGELYLAVSVQEATPGKDGIGRPISRTDYFCVPYARFWSKPSADAPTSRPVSYLGLHAAAVSQKLPSEGDGPPVALAVDPLDAVALARSIRHDFGESGEWSVAATAAALLAGPVTITGPGLPDVMSRLRFIDAVSALLPYGYRPYLTAATWSDAGADQRFRMVFANRASDESLRAQWKAPPQLPAGGTAEKYLGYLQRVLGRGDNDEQLALLIEHLAADGEPRRFDDLVPALDSAHRFFLAETVSENADKGGAAPGDLRQIFANGQFKQLPPARHARLFMQLIDLADPMDSDQVIRWFDEIAAGRPGELVTALADAGRKRLQTAGSLDLSRVYLRFLWPRQLADEMLAQMLAPAEPASFTMDAVDALGELLKDLVISVSGGTSAYPRTQRALAATPAVAAALLARLALPGAQGGQSLVRAVEWLEPAADGVVRPFVTLLRDSLGSGGQPEPLEADTLRALDRDGKPASVRYLLRAASYRNRLRLVLPALACWLTEASLERGVSERTARYWDGVSRELSPSTMDEAAWLDLTLLITGNSPRALLSGRYSQPQFSRQLASAWRELTALVRSRGSGQADALLESALIAALRRESWRGDTASATAVRDLVDALSPGDPRPDLMAVVLDTKESLRQLPAGAAAAQVAQLCARAYRDGLPVEQVGRMLADSGAVTAGAEAVDVLEEMRRALLSINAPSAAASWPVAFARWFTEGSFGPRVATEFPGAGARRFGDQLALQVRLLGAVLTASPAEAPPAISADVAERLDQSRQTLEDIVKEARKRQSRGVGLVGRLLGGKASEGGPGDPPATATAPPGSDQAGTP